MKWLGSFCAFALASLCICTDKQGPASWGSDHVGKLLPEFISGDECLFCHRQDIGPLWSKNRHNQTVHDAAADASLETLKNKPGFDKAIDDIAFVLGGRRQARFLKPSAKFGKLDLLRKDQPEWDTKAFAEKCAGCHCTGVDAKTQAFTSRSLDCFVCHGANTVDHSKDSALVHLAKKRKDPVHVVISICAQCHVRDGKSKSTGLPYPNQFVAGDNLFRDFQMDLSDEHLKSLNPADRHVLENVRDVVMSGKEETTCLSCHDVHKSSSQKHRLVATSNLCLNCHQAEGSKKVLKKYDVHSKTCGY